MPAPLKHLEEQALRELAASTVAHYQQTAASFWEATRDHDVSQNIDALVRAMGSAKGTILDVGCGPGRDLVTFAQRGYTAVGLDGCEAFVVAARARTHGEVWQQSLLSLSLPAARFDGLFCNASLFHVPTQELPRVLSELYAALKPGGALLCSVPHGLNEEGYRGARYGAFLRPESWRAHFEDVGFILIEEYFRPKDKPPAEQPWQVTVWRRPEQVAAADEH